MGAINVQVAPVPVFEYKVYRFPDTGGVGADLASGELSTLGAEGWSIAGVMLNGQLLLLGRQVAVRLIPVEEPRILGTTPQLKLQGVTRGNGR